MIQIYSTNEITKKKVRPVFIILKICAYDASKDTSVMYLVSAEFVASVVNFVCYCLFKCTLLSLMSVDVPVARTCCVHSTACT